MSLHDLQNALHDLARVWIMAMLGFGSELELVLGSGSGFGQKLANCACMILKLCSAFCKLLRLTNRMQQCCLPLSAA